jgi:hypothetical protein
MTDLELVFTMLGEKSTAAIAQATSANGFSSNAVAARAGGKVAGDARKGLEKQLGGLVVSRSNFLRNVPQERPSKTNKKETCKISGVLPGQGPLNI